MSTNDAAWVPVTPYLKIPNWGVESYQGLLTELTTKANELQSPYQGEFSQQAAAIHEASHCVVAAREGHTMKSAAIWRVGDDWLGEFFIDHDDTIRVDTRSEDFLAYLRILLAGRRGELLFQNKFCLRAGLEELAYTLIMVMVPVAANSTESNRQTYYDALWGTLLAEVDETLLSYKGVAHDIADKLMRRGVLRSKKLFTALAEITKREAPPALRTEIKLSADDPLA